MKSSTPRWTLWALLLVVVTTLFVFGFQRAALTAGIGDFNHVDITPMQQGYVLAQSHGTSVWWYSHWINLGSDYFRPIASYIHYAQFYVLGRFGFQAVTGISLVVYVAFCLLCGYLTWLITANGYASIIAITVASMIDGASAEHGVATGFWLAYFPNMDNFAGALFQMSALCLFILFSKKRQARYLLTSWVAFILAMLCKESTAFTPLILVAMVLGLRDFTVPRKFLLAHLGMMLSAAFLVLRYGRIITGKSGSLAVLHGFWATQLNTNGAWLIGVAVMILLSGCFYNIANSAGKSQLRTYRRPAMLTALTIIGLIVWLSPTHDLPRGAFAMVYLVDNIAPMFWDTVRLALLSGFAWATLRYKNPLITMVACLVIAKWPFVIAGVGADGGRIIFVAPFMATTVGIAAQAAANLKTAGGRIARPRFAARWPLASVKG